MANQQDRSKEMDSKNEGTLNRDADQKTGVKETWPVHEQPGAKDDARIAGKPGATSRN